jgi:hypothetical protein
MKRKLFNMTLVCLFTVVAVSSCEKDGVDPVVDPVDVTGVTLNKHSLSLAVDSSETLTANVTPDNADYKTVTWTTSDVSIVSVANGIVTAVAEGSAKIVASVGGLSDTCSVTVIAGTSSSKIYLPKRIYGVYEEMDWSISFEYDDQNRLINAIVPHEEYRIDFSYPDGRVYHLEYLDLVYNSIYRTVSAIRSADSISETRTEIAGTFSHSEASVLTLVDERLARSRYSGSNSNDDSETVFFYDDDGNLIRVAENDDDVLSYRYDDRNGIFSNINTPDWLLNGLDIEYVKYLAFNVNNVIELKDSYNRGKGRVITYVYMYNEDGFPVSFQYTETGDDGDVKNFPVFIEYY